jgi:hypothetical protein
MFLNEFRSFLDKTFHAFTLLALGTLVQRLHDLFQTADVTFGLFQVRLEIGS